MQSFTQDEKAMFVQFVTGSCSKRKGCDMIWFVAFAGTSKVPLEGFKAIQGMRGVQKFNIHKAYGGDETLPSAHTCFNQLDLPEYTSEEQMREKLLFACREGSEGFGFG